MRLDEFESKKAVCEYLKETEGLKTVKECEKYLRQHLPLEKHYQGRIIKAIEKNFPNAFVYKSAAGPYMRAGIPDVIAIIGGRFYGFEVKRPFIGKLSAIQLATIKAIRNAGGVAEVVSFPAEVEAIIIRNMNEEEMAYGYGNR